MAASEEGRRLSIVIPAYNCAAWLRRAVTSAYSISPGPLDVIVVDDGSTDDTPEVLSRLCQDFPELRVVSQPNAGLSAARNVGIGHALGEYVVLLDADDELIPCDLEPALALAPDVLRVGVEEVRIGGDRRFHAEPEMACTGAEYFAGCAARGAFYTPSWAYVLRRDYIATQDLQFMDGLLHEDMLFSVQALLPARRFVAVPIPVYRYFRREQSITSTRSPAHLDKRVRSLDRIAKELLGTHQRVPGVGWWATNVLDYAHSLSTQSPWLRTRARVLTMAGRFAIDCLLRRDLRWDADVRQRLGRAIRVSLGGRR